GRLRPRGARRTRRGRAPPQGLSRRDGRDAAQRRVPRVPQRPHARGGRGHARRAARHGQELGPPRSRELERVHRAMRYDDPQLLDALAREYVLGTLHARPRARFARVLSFSLVARRAVGTWGRRLAPLAAAVRPVAPPEASWRAIEAALGLSPAPRA